MPDRQYSAATGYRYGFNGKEKDTESPVQYDYGFRIYDPRLVRFKSVDPLSKNYPSWSPYPFAMNRPIDGIDLDGLEFLKYTDSYVYVGLLYDPILKKITGAETFFRVDEEILPITLNERIKAQADRRAASFIFKFDVEPALEDVPDSETEHLITSPTKKYYTAQTYSNNKERREKEKSRQFWAIAEAKPGNAKFEKGMIIIQIATKAASFIGTNHMENIINEARGIQSTYASSAISIINAAIENGTIPENYLNTNSLKDIANYLLYGKEITKFEFNEKSQKWEILNDESLTKIAKSLWSNYESKKNEENQKKLNERIDNYQNRAPKDNTSQAQPVRQ